MKKKGVELTFNTIIVAILVLIVLVVVVYIFINQSGLFMSGISKCENRYNVDNFKCTTKEDCSNVGGRVDYSAGCPNKEDFCCVLNIDTKV